MATYVEEIIAKVQAENPGETEFHNTVKEVLTSIAPVLDKNPKYQQQAILERIVEPERVVMFRVPWTDDAGKVHVNKGYRVQFNSAIGPYKGGLRLHPSVNLSIRKFVGVEQSVKNAQTPLPVVGGKGLGGYSGGRVARPEATGYGLLYFTKLMLADAGIDYKDQTVVVSGSGNVATYAIQKAQEFGAKVVACSDSNGYVYDKDGIDLNIVKEIKEVRRGRIKEYVDAKPSAEYHEGCKGIWTIPCDIALPCATQQELELDAAKALVANGVKAVGGGANVRCTLDAIEYIQNSKVLFAPAKAANAGGVAVSALEMAQNSMRYSWTFEEVDNKLKTIMADIYENSKRCAKEYGHEGNLLVGCNIAGFLKVADAMLAQGVC